MIHGILGALGGTTDVQYERDPQTGKMVATYAKSGPGQQWKRIIAGGLAGAAKGASVAPGPGHLGRSAGAGFDAGFNLAEKSDEKKYDRANTDFEVQQRAAVSKAQIALLNQENSKSAFELGRAKMTAQFADADRENSFNESVQKGGGGSTDLGVARTFEDVLKMHSEMPDLTKQQAQGNIISSPHINDKGEIDGMRYALVTPEWKAAKLDHDEKLHRMVPPTKVGEQPTDDVQIVKAGTMTNGEFHTAQMASDAEKMKYYGEQSKEASETNRTKITAGATVEASREHAGAIRYAADKGAESRVEVAAGKVDRQAVRDHDKNYVLPAEGVEKSYQMMDHAYQEYNAAKAAGKELPTGAQSMLALSTHLSTTFGNVKGARITKDMIEHHFGARGISDAASVAVQKLSNGDALSPGQWEAFHDLIKQSRMLSWQTATKEAMRKKIPVDFLPEDLRGLNAPANASDEVYAADGKTLIGHVIGGQYYELGKEPKQ